MINRMCDECNEYIKNFNEFFNPEPFYFYHHKIKDCQQHSLDKHGREVSCVFAYANDLLNFVDKSFVKEVLRCLIQK